MKWLSDNVSAICTSIVISGVLVLGNGVVSQAVQKEKLEQNIKATEGATMQMRSLELSLAAFQERYITRAEFEAKLKELRNGT